MTVSRPVEERITRWLAESAPEEVPHRILEATFEITRSLPQERPLARAIPVRIPRWTRGPIAVLAAAVLLVLALVAVLVVGARLQQADTPDLRSRVLATGVIRIAVRSEPPQAVIETVGLSGFDIDVATEIARRLGVRIEIVTVTAEAIEHGTSPVPWDLAFPSVPASVLDSAEATAGAPYYAWPRYLLVPVGSSLVEPGDLAGHVVCAVAGDTGGGWAVEALAPAALITRPTDDECIAELQTGGAAAVVTARLGPADLDVRTQLRSIGGPPQEVRVVVARRADRPEEMLDEVDRLLHEMARDGTLADLSRLRFGGLDLSTNVVQGG